MKIKPPILRGRLVYLKEIEPSDFEDIVRWRNDPENNRYLNQPYVLTLEKQREWYEKKYLPSSDVLFIFFDAGNHRRFGTLGYSDYDNNQKICVSGRLLVGEKNYRASPYLLEANLLFYSYLFDALKLQRIYCHIVLENKKAIVFNKKLGFLAQSERVMYPQYLEVANMKQQEYILTPENFEKAKQNLIPIIDHFANQME